MNSVLTVLTTADTPNKQYVDDVFSTYVYDGNGGSASQFIQNGLNFISTSAYTTLTASSSMDGVSIDPSGVLAYAVNQSTSVGVYKNGGFQSTIDSGSASGANWIGTCQDSTGAVFAVWQYSTGGVSYFNITKIASDGSGIVWQTRIRATDYTVLTIGDIHHDGSNLFISGGVSSFSAGFVMKIDPSNGNRLWTVARTNVGSTYYGVTTDSSGNIYASGFINDGSYQYSSILKINQAGTVLAEYSSRDLIAVHAQVDSSGNIYVVGRKSDSQYYFLQKLNSSGTEQWANYFQATTNQATGNCRVAIGSGSVAISYHEQSINSSKFVVCGLNGTVLQKNAFDDTISNTGTSASRRVGVFYNGGYYFYVAGSASYQISESDAQNYTTNAPADITVALFTRVAGITSNTTTINWTQVADTRTYTYISTLNMPSAYKPAVRSDGGMVMTKARTNTGNHTFVDTVRGAGKNIYSNTTGAESTANTVTVFRGDGYTVGTDVSVNAANTNYVSRAFRKAPQFMDIVTYSGDTSGVAREIPHNLGATLGWAMIKRLDSTSNWWIATRLSDGTYAAGNGTTDFALNTAVASSAVLDANQGATVSTFKPAILAGTTAANVNGGRYVAYLFAHDPSLTGLIQCGSYTGGMSRTTINAASGSSSSITIPAGVTSLYITGQGGTGGDNSYYIPAVDDKWSWAVESENSYTVYSNPGLPSSPPPAPADYTTPYGTGTTQFAGPYEWAYSMPPLQNPTYWVITSRSYYSYIKTAGSPEQSGGGPYSGQATTVTTPNGSITFDGGYGGAATQSSQVAYLTNTGSTQTVSYSVGSGGNLSIGYDTVTGSSDVTLSWEPQAVFVVPVSNGADRVVFDTQTGMSADGNGEYSRMNKTDTSLATTQPFVSINPQGFSAVTSDPQVGASGVVYAFMAIRRSNKPPKLGSQVFQTGVFSGGSSPRDVYAGFSPDLMIQHPRDNVNADKIWVDRPRGFGGSVPYLNSNTTTGEGTVGAGKFTQTGWQWTVTSTGTNGSGYSFVDHMFKRAAQVFDIVTYKGDGTTGRVLTHNLLAVPELVILKKRSASGNWPVFCSALPNAFTQGLNLCDGSGQGTNQLSPVTAVSALNITLNKLTESAGSTDANASGVKYVAYLFASKAGVSKVGKYIGTASDQIVDCGFVSGARYVLIKRTDTASGSDWYVYDTVRGIVVGNEPYTMMNQSVENNSQNYIDPHPAGFIAKSILNVASATYMYLAIA